MAHSQYMRNREVDQLVSTIKKMADYVGRSAVLIEDVTLRSKLAGVLDELADVDKNLAADVQTVDELTSSDLEEGITLKEKFHQIRASIEIEELGRCHAKIDEARQRVTATATTQAADDGPDMEVLSMTYSDKDPISKQTITDPVKNSICGHVYDRESVSNFIDQCKKHRQLCQCPVRSCPNKQALQMARMVPFPEFFSHIQRQSTSRR